MGSGIPLPALAIRPPEQVSPLDQMAKISQLRNLQQQNQSGQLENQQRAQQIKDQQAMTQAMLQWDPKLGYDALAHSVLQNGGSATAATAIHTHGLEVQQKTLDLAKADEENNTKHLDNLSKRHDMLLGSLNAVMQGPDEGLGQRLAAATQQAQTDGLIDAPHAQQIAQFSQLPPEQLRPALAVLEKGLLGEKEQFSQVMTERERNSAEWKEAGPGQLINTRTGETKGTLRQPVDQQELTSYLSDPTLDKGVKNKNAATFASWKAKQSPMMMAMGNMLGGAASPAVDQAAQRYLQTGELPAGFSRSPGTTAAIINRAAELDPNANIAANKANMKANQASLQKLQTNFDQVTAFENTAIRNLDLTLQKAAAVPELGTRFANTPIRMISERVLGTPEMAAFRAALLTAQTESAKVLSSANAQGVLSDSARHEAEEILSGNLPLKSMVSAVNTLKQDFGNRHQSYQLQLQDIQKRIGGQQQGSPAGATSEPTATGPGGHKIAFRGGKWVDAQTGAPVQ